MVQVVECLLCKCKAGSSNPVPQKKLEQRGYLEEFILEEIQMADKYMKEAQM
jgi:hypothetical protein